MIKLNQITGHQMNERLTRKRRFGILATASVLVLSQMFTAQSMAQGVQVFDEPPSPEELAKILFPEKTRSIVLTEDAPAATQTATATDADEVPRIFAMLINFEFGKTSIVKESLPYLDAVGKMLNLDELAGQSIVIEGHTDSVGAAAFNQKLSEKRALAIRRFLVSRHNIAESRLHPVGKGERELHDPNNPRSAINRRVQFRPLERASSSN